MSVTVTKTHFLPTYFGNPLHPITIKLIGVGGTGSLLLAKLARLHQVLIQLDHPGIFVYAYDGDTYENHNVGRQLCTPIDVGRNKAIAMIEKINLNFGLGWEAIPAYFNLENDDISSNIIITCVDNIEVRTTINELAQKRKEETIEDNHYDHYTPFYWMDCGNGKSWGQIVLGSLHAIKQPKFNKDYQTTANLRNVIEIYGDLKKFDSYEVQETKGCSIAESLKEQDVFINDVASVYAANLVKKMLFDVFLTQNGVVFNDFQTMPLTL